MHRTFIVLAALLTPFAARAASPLELQSVTVELPDSDRSFPPGPGSDAVTNNCLVCHSAGMVLNQPALSKPAWTAEVNKMITAYKAPVAPEDVAAIVDYLVGLGKRN
jgi:mono/diheme cytochrome c family protein